jgi:uncharacterized protein YcfJ
MDGKIKLLAAVLLLTFVFACAGPQERYNTQTGAAVGAGVGAIAGQAIGRNTGGTLIGAGIGTLLGAILGNAADQEQQAARDAAMTNKRVVYYDDRNGAVESIPHPVNQQTNCRKITNRVWDSGKLVRETVEEICEGEKKTRNY